MRKTFPCHGSGELWGPDNMVAISQSAFSNAFSERKIIYLNSNFTEIWSKRSSYQYASIGSDNGIKCGLVYWRIYASLGPQWVKSAQCWNPRIEVSWLHFIHTLRLELNNQHIVDNMFIRISLLKIIVFVRRGGSKPVMTLFNYAYIYIYHHTP